MSSRTDRFTILFPNGPKLRPIRALPAAGGESVTAGYASIGALSESVGSQRFGTAYRYRNPATGRLDGEKLPVDLAANAQSLGVAVIRAATIADLTAGLQAAKSADGPVLICIETDPLSAAPDSSSWWDVPIAETSGLESVTRARRAYQAGRARQRRFL